MLRKWAIGGTIVGLILAVITETNIASGAIFGAIVGVLFSKWLAKNLWV